MGQEFWTSLSGFFVSISGIYYAFLVFNRKAPSNPMSWGVWGVIGISFFITSKTTLGINAMTFNMINPLVVAAIGAFRQFKEMKWPSRSEIIGGTIGLAAIAGGIIMRESNATAEWLLALAIVADCVPAIPIIRNSWKNPSEDKPLPWMIFGFGFGIGIFGLNEFSLFNLAVPVYMFFGANSIAYPLARHRMRNSMPITQWA